MSKAVKQLMQDAVIIGGGPTGLLMAKVLSEYCRSVTVLERDMLEDGALRDGRPQAFFAHVNSGRTQEKLEFMFPELRRDLDAYGAPLVPWGTPSVRVAVLGGRLPQKYDFGFTTRQVPQEVFEALIRKYVTALPNVEIVQGARVTGIVMNQEHTQVAGVTVAPTLASKSRATYHACDFLVDASGPNTKMLEWLKAVGFDMPAEVRIDSKLMYAGRHYTGVNMGGAALIGKTDSVQDPIAGILIQVKGGDVPEYNLTVFGGKDHEPLKDEAGFLRFVQAVSEDMYQAIRHATPISPIKLYGNCFSVFRDFTQVTNWPANVIFAGEAKDKGNPRYGTGIGSGTEAALTLRETIAAGEDVHFYFQRLEKAVEFAHTLIKSSEFKYPWTTTTGKRPGLAGKVAVAMFGRLEYVLPFNGKLSRMLFRVQNGYDDPKALQSPAVMLAVLASFLPRSVVARLY